MRSRSCIAYTLVFALVGAVVPPATLVASPKKLTSQAVAEWDAYIALTERRIEAELRSATVLPKSDLEHLKSKKIQIQEMTTPGTKGKDISDGAIHHWFGAVFVPDINLQTVIAWIQKYPQYSQYFRDVERSATNAQNGDKFDIFLRLTRSKYGVTARFNTKHDVVYTHKSNSFVHSVSKAREILQVKDATASPEEMYPLGDDDGYLWRLNSYWRFTERDGGVVIECETVGLSRSLGLAYGLLNVILLGKVRRTANSIAKEALEATLTDLRNGVKGGKPVR